MDTSILWVEKYRPALIKDTILPKRLKGTFQDMVTKGDISNMILSGGPGLGKTTVAWALCKELDFDFIMVNGSDDRNIDTLRDRVRSYASTVSLTGSKKVILFDEADYLNPRSTQPALRGFIEEFSDNCRFIMTCNYKAKIIEPLHSRCAVYEFNLSTKEIAECSAAFYKRLVTILDIERVAYSQGTLLEMVRRHAPDWRRIINECQRYAVSGTIDDGIFENLQGASMAALLDSLRTQDFKAMRKWVANMDVDPTVVMRQLYDTMDTHVKPTSRPVLIVTLAEYDYKRAFVADQEINMTACLTEIMRGVEFI
jgi:DNA polymerase III delta prime subunit